jgi:hypothetical protein
MTQKLNKCYQGWPEGIWYKNNMGNILLKGIMVVKQQAQNLHEQLSSELQGHDKM